MTSATDQERDDTVPNPVQRGRRLGRYILCYELASGGMATVYLARSEGPAAFEKLAAVKVIHPHLAKEREFVDMFLDEARIAARITHPNVCNVFDFGEADGTYYLAMDYLVGETVSRVARAIARADAVASDPRTPLLMARIVESACEGLHAAHELVGDDGKLLNVVHRDVTPQNLFVGYDGAVRVVDFGVASAIGRVHQTSTGTLKGKYSYMSPEQVHRKELDRRSDVWSLGVCLWEMLTRRRLFKRDGEFDTLKAVTQERLPKPSELRADLPPGLDALVMRALERDIDRRYATAREFARALNGWIGTMGGASSGDLADLMQGLFTKEREKRAALLDEARKLDPDLISSSKVARVPIADGSPYEPVSASMPSRTLAKRAALTAERSPAVRWAAIGVFAAVGMLAGVLIVQLTGGDEEEQASDAEATTEPVAAQEEAPEPAPEEPNEEPSENPTVAVAPDPPPAEGDPEPTPDPATPVERPVDHSGSRPRGGERSSPMSQMTDTTEMTGRARGTVAVVTPPGWAEIFVGSRRVGRSPTEVRLPSGRQRIRLLPYGRGPAINRSVNVPAGGTTRLVVRLP